MAATPSTMVPLGTKAPEFKLADVVSGEEISLASHRGEVATVILFICNHCPYVRHINAQLVRVTAAYKTKGIQFIAISSNDIKQYPDDGPQHMKEVAVQLGYPFPYLFDSSQEVARAYEAACTPDIFVYDKELLLIYRGQFDDSRPKNNLPVTGKDLTDALDALIENRPVSTEQKPGIGCNIKWKPH
jgi:peroxiredoxin